jgi:hypothetical protein
MSREANKPLGRVLIIGSVVASAFGLPIAPVILVAGVFIHNKQNPGNRIPLLGIAKTVREMTRPAEEIK